MKLTLWRALPRHAAIHGKRVTIFPKDMQLVQRLCVGIWNYRTVMQLSGMDDDAIEVLPHAAARCRTL